MSSCTTLTVCHNRPHFPGACIYLQLTLNVIQQASLCVQTRLSVLILYVEGWKNVGGVEVCRRGGVWWEGWMGVGRSEMCWRGGGMWLEG